MNKYISQDIGDFLEIGLPFRVVEKYDTHDNGGRNFRVYISDQKLVRVFRLDYHYPNEEYEEAETGFIEVGMVLLEANPERIWVGESPHNDMTDFSGGYGPDFKGNSILLHISGKRYIFIGHLIFMFEALHPIVEYVSPVGNNDVPYPYALDSEDNYYLMLESVVFKNNSYLEQEYPGEPYYYYYHANKITPDLGRRRYQPLIKKHFQGILEWWKGGEQWTMRYEKDPARNYDRMMNDPETFGQGDMLVKKVGQEEMVVLSKEDYINLMEDFGREMGFTPFKSKLIEERFVD